MRRNVGFIGSSSKLNTYTIEPNMDICSIDLFLSPEFTILQELELWQTPIAKYQSTILISLVDRINFLIILVFHLYNF